LTVIKSLVLAVAGNLSAFGGIPKNGYEQAPYEASGAFNPQLPCLPKWHGWGAGELGLEALRARGLANVKAAFCRAAVTRRPFAARRPPSLRFALPLSDRRRLPYADRSNCRWKPAVGPLNFASWEKCTWNCENENRIKTELIRPVN